MDELAEARAARDAAVAHQEAVRADLKAASIRARLAIDSIGDKLGAIAANNRLPPSALSKLKPSEKNGDWSPLRIDTYRTIDEITGGEHRLAELREAFDGATREVTRAQRAVELAEAQADKANATQAASTTTLTREGTLVIDDVLVHQRSDRVVLDVRVRNEGSRAADITRAAVRILTREEFLSAYVATAHYDLQVDGDYNEVGVAHHIKPDDVDRFTLALGFAEHELGCVFRAELVLRFNRDPVAVSMPFTFNSCFE